MLLGDYLLAKECFNNAVSVQQEHCPRLEMLLHASQFTGLRLDSLQIRDVKFGITFSFVFSLIMCGVVEATFERYTEAKTFLEQATSIDPCSVVAWTLLGESCGIIIVWPLTLPWPGILGILEHQLPNPTEKHALLLNKIVITFALPSTFCHLGLLHESQNDSILAEWAFNEARRQLCLNQDYIQRYGDDDEVEEEEEEDGEEENKSKEEKDTLDDEDSESELYQSTDTIHHLGDYSKRQIVPYVFQRICINYSL